MFHMLLSPAEIVPLSCVLSGWLTRKRLQRSLWVGMVFGGGSMPRPGGKEPAAGKRMVRGSSGGSAADRGARAAR